MMRNAGVEVTTGILEKESRLINRRFFTFHEKGRPFVILKWAQTIDGFIDIERKPGDAAQPTWITNEWARRAVHKQRSTEQAILVGTNTALKDDPSLTLRDWTGIPPVRVVIDRSLKLPHSLKIFSGKEQTLILNEVMNKEDGNVQFIKINFTKNSLRNILNFLKKQDIQSVVVEGGRQTLTGFIEEGLWDEAYVYVGDKWFVNGVKAPVIPLQPVEKQQFGGSKLFVYRNKL
jgi:diaminohydroxyphosphoribosylaminopyrimidine deaminase/5-amino-6-(5-phosphoribosylamino)uracil reductase